jgi:hypothetical protein
MKIDVNKPYITTKFDCILSAIQHKSTVRAARNYVLVYLMEETKKMWHPKQEGAIQNLASPAFYCSNPKKALQQNQTFRVKE